MPYTINPQMPRLRAKAVEMVRSGKGIRETSRHFGYNASSVSRWCKKAPMPGVFEIPTTSSRPDHHPKEISILLKQRVLDLRKQTDGRCAEVIHGMMLLEEKTISLSSVKRILNRAGVLKKRSPWKRFHVSIHRPEVAKQGDLVQIDTIHIMQNQISRIYVYTLLDVFSRWAFAWASEKINTHRSLYFVRNAISKSPFDFICLQSDNGPEFSQNFTERIKVIHRHSRVRRPNDNAHLERFNRTIQQEFLNKFPVDVKIINKHLPEYLKYYNEERLHLGINLKTPAQVLRSY